MGPAIRILKQSEYPWDILLEADPSRAQIERYLHRATVLALFEGECIIGVVVCAPTENRVHEIFNIGVVKEFRKKGHGRALLRAAIDAARAAGAESVEIGTGNSSLSQLYLSQSVGFRIVGVLKDYFEKHYPEPIEENGLLCRDMIRLAMVL